MTIRTLILLLFTHAFVGACGFAIGIYALPILIAPPAPSAAELAAMSSQSRYTGEFIKDLKGSDALHWGEGSVSVGDHYITFMGKLAPGPDYKVYLSQVFVSTEPEFERRKASMALVGDVKTFDNFFVRVPLDIDVAQYNTVVVWCETFGEFITAAQYQ